MNLKIGIIGTNFISDDFCDAAKQTDGIELYAVYSRSSDTGTEFADRHNIPAVFTDYDDFLDSQIDAVYVASPNFAHCAQSIKAMEHKKHVLCEKVMASNEQEALLMIECARKNQVVLLEAMRPDFDPAFEIIENALPRIGKIRRATFEFCQYSSRYDRFKEGIVENAFNPELGNAAVSDIGVYCIHSLVRLFGGPKNIQFMSSFLENNFECSGIILMEYQDMIAEAVYSKVTVSSNPSIIQGEDGSILIDYISHPSQIELRLREGSRDPIDGGIKESFSYTPVNNNMIYEIKKFISLIENNETDHKYLSYSLDTIRIIDRVLGFTP